jgi:DNA-binding CsgD family transcriptional regulator
MHALNRQFRFSREDGVPALAQALDLIAAARTEEEAGERLLHFASRYGYDAVACGNPSDVAGSGTAPFFFVLWPEAWLRLYGERNFVCHDPAVLVARRRMMPFTLGESLTGLPMSAGTAEMMAAFSDFGWTDGLAVPIHGPGGYFALVGYGGRNVTLDAEGRAAIHAASLLAHDVCRRMRAKAEHPALDMRLTAREIECLRWVAAGKTDREIAALLGISASTAKFHIDGARRKLRAATRTEAVASLVRLNLT